MTQTVIISGGAGFIGTALTRRLASRPATRLVLLDSLHPQVHAEPEWPASGDESVVRVRGDAAVVEDWDRALAHVDGLYSVVHLAAETGTGQSLTEARRHATVNVVGTAAMTDAISRRDDRPSSIVLTSSRAVYGEGAWTTSDGGAAYAVPRSPDRLAAHEWRPVGEDGETLEAPLPHRAGRTEPRPTNVYAATKLAQEHLLTAWSVAMSVDTTVLRLQNVYGAGQALQNSYTGVLTFFATRALAGEAIEVYEGGEILRDFVHVEDVVSAIDAALAPAPGVRRFDIGSGTPKSLLEVAATMSTLAGAPDPRVTDRYRPGDVRAAYADIAAAAADLRYEPGIGLEQGLSSLLEYASATTAR